MSEHPPWWPAPYPQLDGRLDLIHPENFPSAMVDQSLWEFEVAGLLPLGEEPVIPPAKRHRVRKFLGRMLTELGKSDPYAIITFF